MAIPLQSLHLAYFTVTRIDTTLFLCDSTKRRCATEKKSPLRGQSRIHTEKGFAEHD